MSFVGPRALMPEEIEVALSFWITFRGAWERRGKKFCGHTSARSRL